MAAPVLGQLSLCSLDLEGTRYHKEALLSLLVTLVTKRKQRHIGLDVELDRGLVDFKLMQVHRTHQGVVKLALTEKSPRKKLRLPCRGK